MPPSPFTLAFNRTAARAAAALLAGTIVAGSLVAGLAAPASASTVATVDRLDSVSCPTTAFCVAVGEGNSHATVKANAVLQYSGGAWATVPFSPGSARTTNWQTVSCSSATWCVAAGVTAANLVAVAYYNGSWLIYQGLVTAYHPVTYAMQASCAGTTCMIDGYSNTETILVRGTTLTQPQVPTPKADSIQNEGVWCGSATMCRLTGYASTSGGDVNVEFGWNGTDWATWSAHVDSGTFGSPLECASSVFCVTWDAEETSSQMSVDIFGGTNWIAHSTAYSGHQSGTEPAGFSCVGSSFCLQTGFFYNSSFSAFDPMAYVMTGSTWVLSTLPSLGKNAFLTGGTCASTTDCYAVGMYTLSATTNGATWLPELLHYNGSSWASITVNGLT